MKLKLPKMFPSKTRTRLNTSAVARRSAVPVDDYHDEPQTKLSSAFIVVLLLHVVAVGGIYAFHSIKARRKAQMTEPVVVSAVPANLPYNAPVNSQLGAVTSPVTAAAPATPSVVPQQPVPKLDPPTLVASLTPTHSQAANLPVGNTRVYRVKAGDTPAHVASQFGVTVAELEEVNGNKSLTNLHSGQVLNLPKAKSAVAKKAEEPGKETAKAKATPAKKGEEAVKETAKEAPKLAAGVKPAGKTYVVAKGDNPVGIARRLGVSYEELLKLNSIEDPKKLQIGAVLKVPAKKAN